MSNRVQITLPGYTENMLRAYIRDRGISRNAGVMIALYDHLVGCGYKNVEGNDAYLDDAKSEPTKAAYRPVDSKVFSAGIDLDDKEEDASGNTARDYYDQLVSDFESDKQSIIISEKHRLMNGEITGIQLDGYTRFFEEVTAIVEHQNKGEA